MNDQNIYQNTENRGGEGMNQSAGTGQSVPNGQNTAMNQSIPNGRNANTYGQNMYQQDGYRPYAYNRYPYGMSEPAAPVKQSNPSAGFVKGRQKAKGGFGKRLLAVALSAVLFGVIAGGVMFGVNYGAGRLWGTTAESETITGQNMTNSNQQVSGNMSGAAAANPDNTASGLSQVPVTQPVSGSATGGIMVMDVSDVATICMPSVVSIINTYTTAYNYFGQRYEETSQASGTGIIIGQSETELLIVTNYHVIANADRLDVTFIDTTSAVANLKGYDEDMDIAVVAIQLADMSDSTIQSIAIAILGDSDSLKVGEPAIAIGNALGYGQSVTLGVISALNRELMIDGVNHVLIQTDAAINPGNSGGALVNSRGEVIGINSNKIGGSTVEGMGYAIPISLVRDLIDELSLKETLIKVESGQEGYLGIYGMNVTDEVYEMYDIPKGAYITQVIEGGAAETAGLMRGDIITALEDKQIESMEDLSRYLQYYAAGTRVTITYQRKENGYYREHTVSLTLGER